MKRERTWGCGGASGSALLTTMSLSNGGKAPDLILKSLWFCAKRKSVLKQFTKNWGLFILLGLVLGFQACGGLGKKKPVYPAEVDASMKSAFAAAEGYYNRRNLGTAIKEYEKFISAFAYNQLADEAYYKIGKIYFLQHQWA